MPFDAGAVQGRLELAIEGWKHSVEIVKSDLATMAKESGLSTAQFSALKGVISGLGISLKSELEAKLKAAEAALIAFKNSGQLTADGQKKLEENITKIKNELAGMTGETGKADKAHESLWKQFAIGQIVVDLARKAFSLAKDVIKDSIAEAAAYEKALATLDATFTASGRNMPGMTTRLKEYAKEIEHLGLADETATLQSEALLLRMTNLNEKGIKEATRLATGLAYVYGIDLNTATEIVGKGMEGIYRGFTTLAPQVVKATTDADKHAAMMKFLNDTYVAAQAQTKTYSGEVKTLGLAWGETKKSFGEAILNTEILQKTVQMMTDILNGEAGKHATDIFIFISAATKACVREVLPFLESLQFMKPTLAEARKAALQGRDAWDSYKEGLKNNDEYLIKNKDSIIAWMQTGLENIGLLNKTKIGFNETGKAVEGYTQDFIKARGAIEAEIAKATLSEYEAEKQNLIRTAQLKIEESKASGMREAERIEYEKLQNRALAVSLQALARDHSQKIAAIRAGLTAQILKATSTEFETEKRAAEMEFLVNEQQMFKEMGATKEFDAWKALAREALRVKIHGIDKKEFDDRFAFMTELIKAENDANQKALAGYMAHLERLSAIEGMKQKLKLNTLDYSIWCINEELKLKIEAINKDESKIKEWKVNEIKILEDTAAAKKAIAKREADVALQFNEQIAADFIRSVAAILTGQKSLLDGFVGITDSIVTLWANAMINVVKEGMEAGKSVEDIWKDMQAAATESTAGIIGLIIAMSKAINSIFQELGLVTTDFGKKIGDSFGGITGILGDVIAKIFGIKSATEKAAEAADALKNYKKQFEMIDQVHGAFLRISDETGKSLMELTKKFGTAGAEARMLAQIMQDTGINVDNFDHYLGKATNTLTLMEKGLLDVKNGTALADEQFALLLEAAKKFGYEGSAAMVNFIITARQMGLEIESVTAYVQGELNKIPASLTVMIGAAGDSADALKGMGDIALLTFNSMLASGVSWTDAVFKMGDPLKALAQRYVDLGLTADPALAELMKIVGVTEAHKGLFDALSANDQVLKALGNSGWLTADALKILTKNANDYYNELIATGLTADQALAAMGPTLQDIYDYSKAYGFTLDENTQKLIDEAKAAGKVKDKVDIADVLVSVESVLKRIADIFDRMYGKASDTKKVLDDINGTDYSYNMKENWTSNKSEQENVGGEGVDEYQHGGYVPETGLALLHAGEYVLPPGAPQGFVNAGVPPIVGGAGPVVNNNYYTINAIDTLGLDRWIKGPGREQIGEMLRQNKGGLTMNVNKWLRAMA